MSLSHVPPREVKLNKSNTEFWANKASETLGPQCHHEYSSQRRAGLPSQARAEKPLGCSAKGLQEQTYHGRTITHPEEVWEAAVSWREMTESLISGICNEDRDG